MPTSYVDIDRDEMEYIDGEGWLANLLGAAGGVSYAIAFGITGFLGGKTVGTVVLPVIGTISFAVLGTLSGITYGFINGTMTGYEFGRKIERKLGWG